MPIEYKKYPPNWKSEIVPRILKREKNRCKFCGVKNHSVGYRDSEGKFFEVDNSMDLEDPSYENKIIGIVLTIAHLDHDEANWNVADDRLAALCQRCHLKYDAPEKRRRMKSKKAIGDLFE